ncbi:MAG: hypothetical protein ACKVOE_08555 [Rickettsiales bacterium]
MADELQGYLLKRAELDYDRLYSLMSIALLDSDLQRMKFILHRLKGIPVSPLLSPKNDPGEFATQLTTSDLTLQLCYLTSLCLMGEASKRLEREHPEIIANNASFPWKSLQRMRDTYTHFYRDILDPESNPRLKKAHEKEVEKFLLTLSETPDGSPVPQLNLGEDQDECTRYFAAAVGIYNEMSELHQALRGQPITLPNLHLMETDKALGGDNLSVGLLCTLYHNFILNVIGDSMNRLSCFSPMSDKSPHQRSKKQKIISYRDASAHFGGFFGVFHFHRTGKYEKPENVILSLVHPLLDKFTEEISAYLPNDPYNPETIKNFTQRLVEDYTKSIMGSAASDPSKKEVIDQTIVKIANRRLSARLRDAYIMAAGHLLQKTSADKAGIILDLVFDEKRTSTEKLQNPIELKSLNGLSHTLKPFMKKFAEEAQMYSSPFGKGLDNGRSAH